MKKTLARGLALAVIGMGMMLGGNQCLQCNPHNMEQQQSSV
jgi:hypothetical protein